VIASTIPPLASHAETIGGIEYQVYDYAGLTWMVEDVRHGSPNYTMYNNDINKPGNYFLANNRSGICTGDYRLPTNDDALRLIAFLESAFVTESEQNAWLSSNVMKGYTTSATGTGWAAQCDYYTSNPAGYMDLTRTRLRIIEYANEQYSTTAAMPIRCVRDTD
jgi:uncharacterized protein (TIGR02145 family)